MKKRIFAFALALCALISFNIEACADSYTGKSGWTVSYTARGRMESNFYSSQYNDPVAGLQPGDDITFTVNLVNSSEITTDWYMTNEVIHSLEDRSSTAAGGAYSYVLSYVSSSGAVRELFSSDTIGGDIADPEGEGLHEATGSLKNYFYLGSLSAGQSGKITLKVSLDGETQGNGYQNTLADLKMNFAVETELPGRNNIVRTGDESNIILFFLLAIISGLGMLTLAIWVWRWQKKEKEKEARPPQTVEKGGSASS